MALIACPDCTGQVSDQAFVCPHCGRPLRSPPAPEYLRKEASRLQSLASGCGCLVVLLGLAAVAVIVFLVKHGLLDWKTFFTYTIQRAS